MHPLLNRLTVQLLASLSGREALLLFLSYNERDSSPLIYRDYTLEELQMAAYDKIYTGLEQTPVPEIATVLLEETYKERGGKICKRDQ